MMQQIGYKCECGFFFDALSLEHSFAVIRARDYQDLLQIEAAILNNPQADSVGRKKQPTPFDASQLCSSICICPDCQRLHWNHPDDKDDDDDDKDERRVYQLSHRVPHQLTKGQEAG